MPSADGSSQPATSRHTTRAKGRIDPQKRISTRAARTYTDYSVYVANEQLRPLVPINCTNPDIGPSPLIQSLEQVGWNVGDWYDVDAEKPGVDCRDEGKQRSVIRREDDVDGRQPV